MCAEAIAIRPIAAIKIVEVCMTMREAVDTYQELVCRVFVKAVCCANCAVYGM